MTPDAAPKGRHAVVCITDRNYLLPTKVMLSSLLRVLAEHVKVFVLSSDVRIDDFDSATFRSRIDGVVDYSTSPGFAELRKSSFRGRTHVSGDAMAKLLLPFLFEGYERVLYLDVDMLCCSPEINRLFEMDLGGALVAAVPDAKIAHHPFRETLDLEPGNPYFNSGLILFDVHRCSQHLTERLVIDRSAEISPKVRFVDQDTLNYLYRNKVHYLDLRFNVFANVHMGGGKTLPLEDVPRVAGESFMAFPSSELARAMNERVILHYTSSSKPWKTPCGHDELWWKECAAAGGPQTRPRESNSKTSLWNRLVARWKAALRSHLTSVGEAIGLGALRRTQQQLETLNRKYDVLARALPALQPERVTVPVVIDLRWAERIEALSVELDRLFREYSFIAPTVLLVAPRFGDRLQQFETTFGCLFATDDDRSSEGLHFRTQFFAAKGAELHADYLRLLSGETPFCKSFGAWIDVFDGKREVRTSARRPSDLIKRFSGSRYDDAIAALYRSTNEESRSL